MLYVDLFLIVSSLLTTLSLLILNHKINQQFKELNDIREFLLKSRETEFNYRTTLMSRLGEIQNTRFSSYFKNRGD